MAPVRELEQTFQNEPAHSEAFLSLGKAYRESGKLDKLVTLYEERAKAIDDPAKAAEPPRGRSRPGQKGGSHGYRSGGEGDGRGVINQLLQRAVQVELPVPQCGRRTSAPPTPSE
jgi:hypothetical protein